MENDIQDWTILIYLAGNNDLDPEIFRKFKLIPLCSATPEFHILVQWARRNRPSIHMAGNDLRTSDDQGHGVRRYSVIDGSARLITELPNANMADPDTLFSFITWGTSHYPAKHQMLVLTGHSAGFLGVLLDCGPSGDEKFSMSVPALMNALSKAQSLTGKSLDVVLMDTCFMNLIEIWHEFATFLGKPVQYLLTPTKSLARCGLPLHVLIGILYESGRQGIGFEESLTNIASAYTDFYGIDRGILSVKLESETFAQLKEAVHQLGLVLQNDGFCRSASMENWLHRGDLESTTGLVDLCYFLPTHSPDFNPLVSEILRLLKRSVLAPSLERLFASRNSSPYIYLPGDPREYLLTRTYYEELSFTENNAWADVLQMRSPS